MDDDNWLETEVVACAGCGTQLFLVLHSPYCDDYRLYCERCPQGIDVSFYDPICRATLDRLPRERTWEQIMAAIEPLLRRCACGGRFLGAAPRHCFRCSTVIPQAEYKDVSPYLGCETGDRDPTPEEQAAYDRFEAEFIRRTGLWPES